MIQPERMLELLSAAIDSDALVRDAAELVRLPSPNPPGDEALVAEWLKERCCSLGMQVTIKEVLSGRPNVIARLGGDRTGPTVVWNGHTDVVPPGNGWTVDPFGGLVRDGRLYGRGAVDMKGALAAVLAEVTALRLTALPLHGSLVLTFVVDEEGTQAGTRALVAERLKADCGVVGEPTELAPVLAQTGSLRFEVTLYGHSAHASVPDQGLNAIYLMGRVLDRLQAHHEALRTKRHPLLGSPTVSVGTIEGGTATSVVPDRCRITISRRTISQERPTEPDEEIHALLTELAREDPHFHAEWRRTMCCPASEIGSHEVIAQAARWAASVALGRDPGFQGWPANCDASFLINDLGIPTVILGPGDPTAGAHQPDEFIPLDELFRAAQTYALLFTRLLGETIDGAD